MTGTELLEDRKTRYLFTQEDYDYYECNYRFYKIKCTNDALLEKAIPVDIKADEALSNYYR